MKKLFVGNLPHSTTEAELRTLFEPHGKVDQVSLVTDRDTGRSRGFAFVEMSDSAEAEKAIKEGNATLAETEVFAAREKLRHGQVDIPTANPVFS